MKSFEKMRKKYTDDELLGEIRRHIDSDRFHLNVTMGAKDWASGPYVASWSLFYNYRFNTDYFNKQNGPILSSEKNSLEELYDFVKMHEKKDLSIVYFKCNTTCLFLLLALVFIDIFVVENDVISAICLGYSFGSLISYLVYLLLHNAIVFNRNVDYLYLLETSVENHKNLTKSWTDENKVERITEQDKAMMESKLIDKTPHDKPTSKVVKATVKIDGLDKEFEVANAVAEAVPVAVVTDVKKNEKGELEVTTVESKIGPIAKREPDTRGDDGVDAVRYAVESKLNEKKSVKKVKTPSKAQKKPVEKKKVSTKPNVSKTTNAAKKAVKTIKKALPDEKAIADTCKKSAETIKKLGEDAKKALSTVGTTKELKAKVEKEVKPIKVAPKKKPGRPKKVQDEKVS